MDSLAVCSNLELLTSFLNKSFNQGFFFLTISKKIPW